MIPLRAVIIGMMTVVFLAVSIPAVAQSCCPQSTGKADCKKDCAQDCKKDCCKDCKPGDKCDKCDKCDKTDCCKTGTQGAGTKASGCAQGTDKCCAAAKSTSASANAQTKSAEPAKPKGM
jgi:hypothetical protein